MENIKNLPFLRFPEFKGEWEMKYGNSVFKAISNKNHNSDLPILAVSQEYGAVPREMINYQISVTDRSVESYKIVEIGDFIISLRSFQGGIEYSNYLGICSPAYIILRPTIEISNTFFKYFFKTDYYIGLLCKKLEGIRDGKMISYKYFSEILLPLPTFQEQQKIAAFLTTVDDKLQALKHKKSLLEQYKKGVMQKIFAQELRFKDENGNEFPEWVEKKLGEVVLIKSGLSKEQNVNNTGHRVTRIETISDGTINLEKVGFIEATDEIEGYKINKGDILFSNINSVAHIGKTAIAEKDLDLYHGMNLLCLRSTNGMNSMFIFYSLNTNKLRNHFKSICNQAVSQASINQTELAKTILQIPFPSEQTKIANFLSTIDDKISRTQAQIENTMEYKKGLLQKMFV